MPKTFTTIIPARYDSSRFPGKPLAKIAGQSMISIVYQNAIEAKLTGEVVVATDDERIYDHCKDRGIEVVYTSKECENGSIRVAEVAETREDTHIFELQGDQPLVSSEIIDEFLTKASQKMEQNREIDIVQPYAPTTSDMIKDPDVLKVAISNRERFLVYTRLPMKTGYRTLGLYLWVRESLLAFMKMKETPLERFENTHLNRFLENDLFVQGVVLNGEDWIEVDREDHIPLVERVLEKRYKK